MLLVHQKRDEYNNSLSKFIRASFPIIRPGDKYKHNWHIDAIADYLEACTRGDVQRLIINMPPRALKSFSVTVAWPAWLLGKRPSASIVAASYAKELALEHSQFTRTIMESEFYHAVFPDTIIADGENQKHKYVTTQRGMRFATSVGASVTGMGGDFLIMDDPLNPQQAVSDAERKTGNDWFVNTFLSRFNDPDTGVCVLVMQRVHEEDTTAVALQSEGWDLLKLPAEAPLRTTIVTPSYELVMKKDELLHPERLSKNFMSKRQREMGEQQYSAQYNQEPTPPDGGIYKKSWWKKWKEPKEPEFDSIIAVYDTAFEEDEQNDPSAGALFGCFEWEVEEFVPYTTPSGEESERVVKVKRPCLILLKYWNDRVSYPDLKMRVVEDYNEYRPDRIIIEKKSSGHSLIQDLKRHHKRMPIVAFKPKDKSKVARAHFASIVLRNGQVYYPKREWAKAFVDQCAAFPNSAHDEAPDILSMALIYFRHRFMLGLPEDENTDYIGEVQKAVKKKFYGG